ncbi:MAG: hypothetical protein BWY71_01502 [Planctomycetes bacterium ADurb.Bin412]|nr:MAG: hypothetical protein BWY71_01502 [Planctomycetes bacterium ADurb.Bin412]
MDVIHLRIQPGGGLCQLRIRPVVFIDQAIVAVFREGGGNSQLRFIDPHEEIGTDHKGLSEEHGLIDLKSPGPLLLGLHPHPRAVPAGQAAVKGGKGPFGQHERPAAPFMKFNQVGNGGGQAAGLQIDPRILIDRDDIAIFPRRLPAGPGGIAGESAAQYHMVRIYLPDGGSGYGEIGIGHQRQITLFVLRQLGIVKGSIDAVSPQNRLEISKACVPGGVELLNGWILLLQHPHQGDFGGVVGAFFHGLIKNPAGGIDLAVPFQLIIDENAKDPGVLHMLSQYLAGTNLAKSGKAGIEDIGNTRPVYLGNNIADRGKFAAHSQP